MRDITTIGKTALFELELALEDSSNLVFPVVT
jgi:hypothetical protein